MIKVNCISEVMRIEDSELKHCITERINELLSAAGCDDLSKIGCIVVIENADEYDMTGIEFSEEIVAGNRIYIHAVKVIDENYGEDIWVRR